MLSSQKRLTVSEFFRIPSSLYKLKDGLFFYQYKKIEGQPKIAINVPKRLSKLATQRNRTKRVISEMFKYLYPNLKQDICLLITPNRIFKKEKPIELIPRVQNTFKQENLI